MNTKMCNQKLINILGRYVLILCFLIKCIRTNDYEDINPKSWKPIMKNFYNRIDSIFTGNVKDEEAKSGRFFKYYLPIGKSDKNDEYEAYEEGKSALPKWLSFESKKRKLHGVPTDENIRSGIKIMFRRKHENTVNGVIGESRYIIINVKNNREPFKCPRVKESGSVITTGSIIFSSNISKFSGRKRVRLLRKIAQQFEQPITSLFLEIGHRLKNDVALERGIRLAGPGDRVIGNEPGFTITWKVICGKYFAGDKNIGFLGKLSEDEDFSSTFKDPVMGWFIHTTENVAYRQRRAIGAAGRTPVATPSLTIVVGTPTISPIPSMIVPTTIIRPSKSFVPMASTSVVVLPPVVITRPPSTTEKLTRPPIITTQKPTTEPPTTEQPTTERPTTKQPTTEQPTTEQPTTLPPTTLPPPTTTEKPTTDQPITLPPTTTQKPTTILTTQKPIVTTEEPTTSPPNIPTTGVAGPRSNEKVDPINVVEHSVKEVPLGNIFIYEKDLDITLQHFPNEGDKPQPYTESDWIQYEGNKLFISPKEKHRGTHTFAVKGTDSASGKYAITQFTVKVLKDDTLYNILYNLTITAKNLDKSAKEQVEVAEHIALASEQEKANLRALNIVRVGDDYTVEWSLNDKKYFDCRNKYVEKYLRLIRTDRFKTSFALGGVFGAGIREKKKKACDNTPVVVQPQQRDDGLWQRILIPVIVIVVLLLIIALILCCVYRRKRKANVQIEEDKAYLNHKKPVIFLEEFDEKPHFVSLQPLILPNEKPPADPYEPRADTPEGPGSSTTVSTNSEEKPLTQSPKESSRKGYNAPPPYNSL